MEAKDCEDEQSHASGHGEDKHSVLNKSRSQGKIYPDDSQMAKNQIYRGRSSDPRTGSGPIRAVNHNEASVKISVLSAVGWWQGEGAKTVSLPQQKSCGSSEWASNPHPSCHASVKNAEMTGSTRCGGGVFWNLDQHFAIQPTISTLLTLDFCYVHDLRRS